MARTAYTREDIIGFENGHPILKHEDDLSASWNRGRTRYRVEWNTEETETDPHEMEMPSCVTTADINEVKELVEHVLTGNYSSTHIEIFKEN